MGTELATLDINTTPIGKIKQPKRFRYLMEYLRCGEVVKAAKRAGCSRFMPSVWRKEDEDFAKAEEFCLEVGSKALLAEYEDLLGDRIRDDKRKMSDTLLMFAIKKLDPSYRDNPPPLESRGVGDINLVFNVPPRKYIDGESRELPDVPEIEAGDREVP